MSGQRPGPARSSRSSREPQRPQGPAMRGPAAMMMAGMPAEKSHGLLAVGHAAAAAGCAPSGCSWPSCWR